MNIKYMLEFVELARTRNITKTADALFISQPALSRHIALMEAELGVKLLNRSKQGIELTGNGKIALDEFKQIIYQYTNLLDRFSTSNENMTGEIVIGLPYYAVDQFLAPLLREFAVKFPGIRIRTFSNQIDMIFYSLLEESIDVGFFALQDKKITGHSGLVFEKLAEDSLEILCNPHHVLAQDTISIKELSGKNFVWLASKPNLAQYEYNQYIKSLLARNHVHYKTVGEIENIDFLSSVLSETDAFIVIPKHIAEYHPRLKCVKIQENYTVGLYAAAHINSNNPAIPIFLNEVLHMSTIKTGNE